MGIVIVKINFSSALNFAIFVSATTAPMVHQASIARDTHSTRIGRPARALASKCEVREMKVSVPYPKHTRFLDMKKTRTGKKKRRYEPIYNNYVYGYINLTYTGG